MTAAIALQNIGNDRIRIIAAIVFATTAAAVAAATAVVGDSGVYGGINGSRNTAGGSNNIMNGAAATAITAVKIMSDGSVAASSNSDLL